MTVIAIKYADPAKPDKKYGSIKDTAGTKYLVPASMNGMFQPGTTVDVPTRTEPWTAGVAIVSGPPAPMAAQAPAPATAMPAAPQQSTPQPAPQAATIVTPGCDRGGEIFVTGVVGRAMGSGQFGLTDLTAVALAAAEAWQAVKGKL